MKNNRSPINYIGNKNKLIDTIKELAPNDISMMYDVFGGSGVVSFNVDAKMYMINDINTHIIYLLNHLQSIKPSDIDYQIEKYKLTSTNLDGFLKLRSDYNDIVSMPPSKDMSILLYTLLCYSYNNQFRFNNSFKYNSSFGLNRSHFNDTLRKRLTDYHDLMDTIDVAFTNVPYEKFFDNYILQDDIPNSFVYLDPPYLITTGNYNDGKRGFGMWNKEDDIKLYSYLDTLNENGIKFMLSNVTHHKGLVNEILMEFSGKYNVTEVKVDYSNASYNANTDEPYTREIIVTNYQ